MYSKLMGHFWAKIVNFLDVPVVRIHIFTHCQTFMCILLVLNPSGTNYGCSYSSTSYGYTCFQGKFFSKFSKPKIFKKTSFFSENFENFQHFQKYIITLFQQQLYHKPIQGRLRTYKTLFTFIYETTMIAVHVAHNSLKENFRKKCLFFLI